MEKVLKKVYAEDIDSLCMKLDKESQVCLCGVDKEAVEILVRTVSTAYKKRGFTIHDINQQEEMVVYEGQTLVVVDIGRCSGLSHNKMLYFYLEQTTLSDTKILMYSNDCQSLDGLERRVKSRFNDNVHILRSLTFEEFYLLFINLVLKEYSGRSVILDVEEGEGLLLKNRKDKSKRIDGGNKNSNRLENSTQLDSTKNSNTQLDSTKNSNTQLENRLDNSTQLETIIHRLSRQYKIHPSLDSLRQIYFKDRYDLEDYSDTRMLSRLNNIHLSILILARRKRLVYSNVVREFKVATNRVKELKKVRDEEILFYYYDLVDFGLISEKGLFLYTEIGLKEYILSTSPTYLKGFLKSTP